MPFHIVLVEPEIPSNTGNIVRTCSVTGSVLHLVHPLGFSIEDRYLKRAGLDYWNEVEIHHHDSLQDFLDRVGLERAYLATTKAKQGYHEVSFQDGDYLLFGKETKGLPEDLIFSHEERAIRIPMLSHARSLNLSNSVAIVLYEALRQIGFPGFRW
ncbi:putative tRNA (cytidine(34)-2'-O)-methyltransferase [[Clostridium] ultunense Esp]|uniref:tRNA (uridine(34)/cytosine(34)/5- carboxymethylaminomethyluridine(34)-2'-O)- methyltransferase TrmL n=1 Tax=Thermicanus aegyptius TaxID=94009 RepID=UPI0002B70AA1|nr:tRNA (uridine(34)/cytosine(34)/5-carboxymethylaminomethyluridine(34)-2'-O)-methyltransferase TrmL [Thermicanus aegyptius]CCQ94902.1 putative tRNA (cytidine(34)-2'-O)-methyltransferase [[Clostridium] ultunense Esp]